MNKGLLLLLLVLGGIGYYFYSTQEDDLDFGWKYDARASQEFIRELGPNANLRSAAPHLFRDDSTKNVYLYRAVDQTKPGHFPLNQGQIGSCVSFGTGACIDILTAMQFTQGLSDKWLPICEESIYGGARCQAWNQQYGGYNDGASGAGAARWLNRWGSVFRDVYPSLDGLDLRNYDINRCKDWGAYGSGGKKYRSQLDEIAKQHPVRQVALVKTIEEAKAALQNGYPIAVCSGQGFNRYRDKDGFASPAGRWSHCMCICGYRNGPRAGFLILNSWGKSWITGPKFPEDQPDGSFWVEENVIAGMLAGGDSYAYSNILGFPRQKLNNSLHW